MPIEPQAFLCHATEDKALAERIATSLYRNGVKTFFDKWDIGIGDSLRQKIDAGLSGCTHFVILLTPASIQKPWVNAEMDAAFVQHLEGRVRFMPIRHQLPVDDLTPLIKAKLAPEITTETFDEDIQTLVHAIYGVSDRPPLGPSLVRHAAEGGGSGFSESAVRMAHWFVTESKDGYMNPQITVLELVALLSLSKEDVIDGMDELDGAGALQIARSYGGQENHTIFPRPSLFAHFDQYWMDWDPKVDAVAMAGWLLNHSGSYRRTAEIAEEFGWTPRRLNPAISVIVSARAASIANERSYPEYKGSMMANSDTRRYYRSHT